MKIQEGIDKIENIVNKWYDPDREKYYKKPGSPCNTCIIKSVCSKSVSTNDVCEEFLMFIINCLTIEENSE